VIDRIEQVALTPRVLGNISASGKARLLPGPPLVEAVVLYVSSALPNAFVTAGELVSYRSGRSQSRKQT
jgi:hypothetical protein